jgi:myo-inositol 2-dehydrogenase/D-chiro-inositol 1-dehydrogenase
MSSPLKLAIAGLGRMGWVHAGHALELERETGVCRITALADADVSKARRFADEHGIAPAIFGSAEALARSGAAEATVAVTPTALHRAHAAALASAGQRVLLEKPLTGSLEGDEEFCRDLDARHPNAIMLAFQRRFDPALQYAKELMAGGLIGRVFKIYSALEDSGPAPNGYQSGGILPDMSVHNVDEILWLTGKTPRAAAAIGARIHSHKLTTCEEDFDDALLYLWFEGELVAQVQVSRNHVSGYRVETVIYGEEGQIQIGRFDQRPHEILVQAFGRRGSAAPLASRSFPGGRGGPGLPEFVERFGPAYKAEVAAFVECCRSGAPFPSTHNDGLRAQRAIALGMNRVIAASA